MGPGARKRKYRPGFAILRALRHRNYRLFFGGQSLSVIGTWLQIVAMSWLVYRLSESAFLLGVIGFCGQLPNLLLAPVAGALADRWQRRRILLTTQSLSMLQAFTLATLVFTDWIAVWQIVPLSIFQGCVNAFDIPARQSLLVDIIEDRNDLGNAIALNSSMVNGARLIGPAVAGVLIAIVGEALCFLLNGISYLAVLTALYVMRPTPHSGVGRPAPLFESIRDGFRYVSGFPPVRVLLLLLALISIMGMPYTVLMPIFASTVLSGGPHTLGFLMASAGIGALCAALYLASRSTVLGLGRLLVLSSSIFGIALVAFSYSKALWLSVPLLAAVGFGMLMSLAGCNTIIQTIVDDDKRGRVMSFYTMAFMGMTPWGSLLAGTLASRIGAPATVRLGGLACIIGAALFASRLPRLREMIRPIYRAKGILPPLEE